MTEKKTLQIAASPGGALVPTSLAEAKEMAQLMAGSDMVPASYKGSPGNVLVAVQMGAEVGLKPLQALQNIAVINGRPSLWGDAVLAVCQAHRDYEYCNEAVHRGESDQENYAECVLKRKGAEPHVARFSVADAKRAGLWGRNGPWSQYPQRMLAMRARSWACRNVFADALRGMQVAEEQQDIVRDNDYAKPAQDDYLARFEGQPKQIESSATVQAEMSFEEAEENDPA